MIIKGTLDPISAFIIGDVNRLFAGGTVENQQDCSPLGFQLFGARAERKSTVFFDQPRLLNFSHLVFPKDYPKITFSRVNLILYCQLLWKFGHERTG